MAAKAHIEKFRTDFTKKLHEPNRVNDRLAQVEQKTGVDRFFLVTGLLAVIALYMIFGHYAELVCNLSGFLIPAYLSVKAVESSNKSDDTQWLIYWVVFGFFNVLEFTSEYIESYFPIYWLVKAAFMLYLWLPSTLGAQKLYVRFIRPFVLKHDSVDRRAANAVNKTADAVRDNLNELNQKYN